MNRWICCTVSILALALISGVVALGQGFPDCRWNCRSNDVALESIYLEGPSTCLSGETVDATLYGMFVNGTGTERYDVALLADLVITSAAGTAVTELTVTNLTASIPPGSAALPIAEISFPCGAGVELRDVIVSWDTKEGGDLSCSARAVKCSENPRITVHDTPVSLVAEFSSSSLGCVEVPVSFINQTTGGTASSTSYSWDFGDGVGTSTNANPSYAYQYAGSFSVYLTVSDGGASTTASHEIVISEAPDASVWNSGPYCPGDTIELFAEGGTSYEWTGPGGFAASEQNPTIPGGEAGIYTVTVTNEASCSSSESTNVVLDEVNSVLSLPADATVECGDDVSPASTGQATASDSAGASVSVTHVDAFASDGCSGGTGSIQRTWTATDSCGNTSSETQTIVVVDTTAPSLAISSLTLECDGAGNVSEIETWLQSAATSDACDDVVVSHDYTGLSESCPGVGETTVAFVAADSCGNATQRTASVSVVDTTPPTAVADTAITDEDVAAEIDVLHNDSDVCGSALVLLSVGTPSFGVVEIVGEQVRYTPPAGFNGTDSFSYTVADCSDLQSTGQVEVTVLARNDAPEANEALLTISEDVTASLTLTASDPDGDVLSYGILNGPSQGTITGFDETTGTLTYTPDPNFHGEDALTFEACDPDGACGNATVTITVESVDDQPVADKQGVNTPEDTAIAIQVTGSDVDGEALTYSIVSGPSRGTISGFDETTGELIYTPAQHYTGTDGFVFDVSDSHVAHGRPQATVTIMVTPVNDDPVANDQVRATSEDTATGFFALAIEDADNTLVELECDCVEPPLHGSIERGPDHTVNYTPDPDYTGTDTFTYIVCDPDDLCDTATVTVTISATNDNPSVSASNQTTPEDTPIDIPVTHSDPDGDRLTCTRSDPAHGAVNPQSGTLDGPYPATATLTYTPEADFVGVDQIVMRCDDGNGGSDSVTIEITVTPTNDRPEANDGPVTMPEDTSATITMTGSDPDLDVLSFEIVGGPSHGTITGLDGATGPESCGSCHTAGSSLVWATGGVSAEHLTYTPAQDYYGTDEIIFQTCDPSGACDTGVVTIVVEPADDNPIPNPQAVTTPEDVAKGIVLTAVEPDGEALTYGIVSDPSHGTITGFDEDTGELIYVPDENYVGTDSFVFEACDPDAEHGCPQATVAITVTSVNDPPNAAADTVTTVEGRSVSFAVAGVDVDGDELTFQVVVDPGFGEISAFDPTTGELTYTPNPLFSGSDEFVFAVCDPNGACAQATLTIDVTPRNDAPVANEALLTISEDVAASLTLTASDPDGDVLTYGIMNGPSHGTITGFDEASGTLTYTPDLNFHGVDSFTFETCDPDGACDSATVTITVAEVDNLPVADKQEVNTPEDTAIAIRVTGSDVDGEALTYSIVSGPSRGTISGFDETTGELIYTPGQHYTGTDGFVFDVSDSQVAHGRPQATVTIMVTPVNDAPVASDQMRATSENTATGFFALAIEDPDNTLAELESNFVEAPQHGSIERGPDHTVNYTPDPDYTGTDTFTYIVCDPDGLCDTATVTVTISATNDNPSVSASNQTTPEDTPIDIPVTHSDPDGDTLTCTAGDPAHGTVNPQSGTMDGPYPMTETVTYTPEADFVGVDQIVMRCDDGNGGSDSVTIEITVTPANDRPEANDGPVTMPEDTSATITMTGSDPDLDVLSFEIVGGPSHGTITGLDGAPTGPDGCGSCHTAGSSLVWATGGVSAEHLTYTPTQDYYGTDEIIFQTCDSSGACDTGVVTIVVEPVDDNPIPDPQAVTTPEDVAKGIVLTAAEPDGDALSYEIVSSPSHGTITGFDEDTGELIYIPNENYAGTDSFVFEACDPDGEHGCPQATVTITVTSVNDPPVATDTSEITFEDTALPTILPGTDVDGDNLVFSILSGPINGSLDILDPLAGSYIYIPDDDFNGIDEFTYEVCDPSGACDQGFVHIDVLPVNDEPVAQSANRNTFQDTSIDIQLTAADPEPPDLAFSLELSPSHGTFLNWDETTGEVRYQPEPGYVGSDSFLFRVCDPDGACDTARVSIDVIDVNDPPRGAYLETTVNQGEPTPLVARATDPDGEPLTYSLVAQPVYGRVDLFNPNTGEFEYVSDDDYSGPDLVRFEVCDVSGACDIGVIQLNVVPVGGGGAAEACPNVVISEIAWAGTAAGVDDEWIELRNLESVPVELEGWFLRWRDIFATEPEDRAWRVLPLTGTLEAYQEDVSAAFESNPSFPNSWWGQWTTAPSPDHFIAERGDDETILPKVANLVYPMVDRLGLSTQLPDEVAVVELIGPSGCLVDTANIDWPRTIGWQAGSADPPASMERTDLFAEDGLENWHSNLGLARAGFDAFGNLLHATPGVANSPIMAQAIRDLEYGPTSHPVGEPIVIPFEDRPLWSDDSRLWHVVVTQVINDDVLPVEWDVIKQEDGSIAVIIQTNRLPLNTTLHVWVRTPTADVLFVPYLVYPY